MAVATASTFIYGLHENRKYIAKLLHTHIHGRSSVVHACFKTISYMDSILYSPETRSAIRGALSNTEDALLHAALESAEQTRQDIYHFCVKGSNCLPLLLFYLQTMYGLSAACDAFPTLYESDWDTTILINPTLTPRQFSAVFETLIPILQEALIVSSRAIRDTFGFVGDVENSITMLLKYIQDVPECAPYRKYPIKFKSKKATLLKIHDPSSSDPIIAERVARFGIGGAGLFVSSNRDGGIAPKNRDHVSPKFYLGRIMASVVASKDVWLPVELFDISMNYQNDDLRFSWDSYSEYHLVAPDHGIDFRVISPVGLYTDLVKCLYNAERSNNTTRKNKAPARAARIQQILDKMILPYKNRNATIRANIAKHAETQSLVGTIVRRMNDTRRSPRNSYRSYYAAEEETLE